MASATSWKTPSISRATTVEVNAWWNTETVEIVISDDGPGFAPDMLKRIGEPYLSRRRSADEAQSEHRGLGLGVFIARTLLERTGAKVSFTNRIFPDHGAVVQIAWPRSRFEAERNIRRTSTLRASALRTAPQRLAIGRLHRPYAALAAPRLPRHMAVDVRLHRGYPNLDRHRRTDRPRRPLAPDRGGRQAVPGAAVARHGNPRLHRDLLRQRRPTAWRRSARRRRLSRWWICGSATATASTWCRR